MNKKLLFSIIAVAFVGSLFTVAYAGPALTTITLAGTVDMVSNQIKNLQDPTDPQDAVTKSYVDNLFACEGGSEMCSVGIGECESAGINLCVDGVAQCGATPGTPVTEICDFLDNDCDGSVDEGGVCPVCGNGVIEASEVCDDGNTVTEACSYGQMSCTVCASDCTEQAGSTSFCGDGTIDSANGEQCDDGNNESGDGCSSICLIEN